MLPSKQVVRLSDALARKANASPVRFGSLLHALAILETPGVVTTDAGERVDVQELALRDAHVLRALLIHAGIVPEEPAELPCENCNATFRVAPSTLLEVAPFADLELDDPELDASFNYDKPHPIPRVVVGKRRAQSVRLAPRTVREALPLWNVEGATTFRFSPAIVTAMGIVALGMERRASMIAEALTKASPTAYRAIADLLYDAHYSRRLVGVYRCTKCGARNDLDVPWIREIPYEVAPSRKRREPFPDLDTFEQLVEQAAERIYRRRRVRNVDLIVDDGVPACDDGGVPMLGCYTPGGTDGEIGIARAPEIRIFYRTFESEYRVDRSFDLKGEIDETIDHEITHHLHHLSGDDPLDDDERAEIVREEVQRVGKREAVRRVGRAFVADSRGFLRTTWPMWLLAIFATWLSFCR